MTMKRVLIGLLVVGIVVLGSSCASMGKKEKTGTVIGASAGAVAGAVIGKGPTGTIVGAIIGAAVGGAAGMYIGKYMDKQAKEIEENVEGAEVQRVGEGIRITFDSGILFDVDRSDLTATSQQNLKNLAQTLAKYPDTNILIEGHTDSTGSREHNMTLSERRAKSVAHNLAGLNVASSRFSVMGYGPDQPVAANDTAEGRQKNRRVELAVIANEKLKEEAKAKA
jgi:outer membrane protein OmpA-like peptidoglycan-associated protein